MVEANAEVSFVSNTVTVPASGSATVDLTVTPPIIDSSRLPVYSGWITLNGTDGSSLSIPYQGMAGSFHSAATLVDVWLTASDFDSPDPVGANTTFQLPPLGEYPYGWSLPAVVIDMAFGASRLLHVDIVPMTTCSPKTARFERGTNTIGEVAGFPIAYTGFMKNRGPLVAPWWGEVADGIYVPPGRYLLEVKSLKFFGDPDNLDDYDVRRTVPFTIEYAAPVAA